jgi:hypothetical protein
MLIEHQHVRSSVALETAALMLLADRKYHPIDRAVARRT